MRAGKVLLSCFIAGGVIGGFILWTVFSNSESREFNSLIKQCKEKLEKVDELLKKA
ncbi:hypothetical protein H5T87_02735 [bacterium]|nr:hypothetical protein [bacterium]